MPRDTTPPDNSRVVRVKELPQQKKRSKQVRIKERPAASKKSKQPTVKKTSKTPPKKKKKEKQPKVVVKETPDSTIATRPLPAIDTTIGTPHPTGGEAINSNTSRKNSPKKSQMVINTPSLSAEEELRLLAQAPATTLEQRTPVLTQEQCAFAFDRIDEFTGTRKRGLTPRLFFAYTPEQYRKFIKTGDFISCEGYLSQNSEGGMALNIQLSISSPAAKEKFGDLPPNSNMTLKTMQGKEFFLMSYKGAKATVQGNVTVYDCSFVLTKSDAKQLTTAEVDQVRLRFTEGFQVYEVYYLDFLREQFPCFKR